MRAFLLVLCLIGGAAQAADRAPLAATEALFLQFLDARDAVAYLNSGHVTQYEGGNVDAWDAKLRDRHQALLGSLTALDAAKLSPEDQAAVTAIRVTLADFGDPSPAVANAPDDPECKDRNNRKLDYEALSAALTSCYREIGNQLKFEHGAVDRGSALGLLYDLEEPERRKALFDAFLPLWSALNGNNEPDSPYRRLIMMAAAAEATNGSGVAAAARAIGVTTAEVERWLTQILAAWRDATGPEKVEPWDYRHAMGEANRRLAPAFEETSIVDLDHRFYLDLGVDLDALGVVYDIKDRPDKSPLAYTDFLKRGRTVNGQWQPVIARVVGRYEDGGLGSLNELVHENGHAVHISAIQNRPAYTDWTDTIFTEAFADVPSWSVYEPAWQKKYLGTELPVGISLRGLHGSVMMDVAWSLFEIRMLRDPMYDPNAVWTEITSQYLHIVPHPEIPWWAVRVQLVSRPGYMVNYGLGAVLTAEIRKRTAEVIGPFDAGNVKWHEWTSEKMLRYGSERTAKQLLEELLGRKVGVEAVLGEIRRIN